jgi:hypothetical protein
VGEADTELLVAQSALQDMVELAVTDYEPSLYNSGLTSRYKTIVVRGPSALWRKLWKRWEARLSFAAWAWSSASVTCRALVSTHSRRGVSIYSVVELPWGWTRSTNSRAMR